MGFIPVGHQKFILLQLFVFTPAEWSAKTDLIKSTIFFILQIFKSFLWEGWVNNFYLLTKQRYGKTKLKDVKQWQKVKNIPVYLINVKSFLRMNSQ